MDSVLISAASGLRARMESLDMLANNIANAGTAGYKSDGEFYGLYSASEAVEAALEGTSPAPSTLPVVEGHWTDLGQGTLTPTGSALDLALGTPGFFAASGPSGTLYTRNGNFHLSPDGTLVTAENYSVLGTDGQPLQADPADGAITVAGDGSVQQNGAEIGQVAVFQFQSTVGFDKCGKSYLRPSDPSATPVAAADVEIHQGQLEASNVSTAASAVHLVKVMRQFEMLQKAITLTGEMSKQAVSEVAKVS